MKNRERDTARKKEYLIASALGFQTSAAKKKGRIQTYERDHRQEIDVATTKQPPQEESET